MPSDQDNESFKKAIRRQAEEMNEADDTPKEQSYEEVVLMRMRQTIEAMRMGKPETRSEVARRYAVSITEMEKTYAYFKTWVADFIDGKNDRLD